jgi:hypothetical protein
MRCARIRTEQLAETIAALRDAAADVVLHRIRIVLPVGGKDTGIVIRKMEGIRGRLVERLVARGPLRPDAGAGLGERQTIDEDADRPNVGVKKIGALANGAERKAIELLGGIQTREIKVTAEIGAVRRLINIPPRPGAGGAALSAPRAGRGTIGRENAHGEKRTVVLRPCRIAIFALALAKPARCGGSS